VVEVATDLIPAGFDYGAEFAYGRSLLPDTIERSHSPE
jgi:hypothetical protein